MNINEKPKKNITVVSVNWYSSVHFERLIYNILRKAKFPEEIDFLIIDNTNGRDKDLVKLKKTNNNLKIVPFGNNNLKGSRAHAAALDYSMGMIFTPFTLVVDPDIYIFKEHWDSFCLRLISQERAIAAGIPYPYWKLGKYHNFPSPPFIIFNTNIIKELGQDWSPFAKNTILNLYHFITRQIVRGGLLFSRQRLENYFWLNRIGTFLENIFGICGPDTGWLIAKSAEKKGLKTILFDVVSTNDSLLSEFKNIPSVESLAKNFEVYHFFHEPIITHQYSSKSYVWKTQRGGDTDFWLACINDIEKSIYL